MTSYDKILNRKRSKNFLSITVGMLILIGMIQPAIAWGSITHMAIDSNLKGVPKVIKSYPTFTKGGGIGPDIFFSMKNSENFSILAHTTKSADLGREMLRLANISHSNREKAFSYGWLSHSASDIIGHRDYVNPISGTDISLHYQVEIGVDANVLSETGTSFSLPYGLIQTAYTNIYGSAPSYSEIYGASQKTAIFIFLEKDLIKSGFFDDLKQQYGDFRPKYQDSINYSKEIINNPSLLPNANLGTGSSAMSEISAIMDINRIKAVNNDMMNASIESIENNVVNVIINDNKISQYMYVRQPIIKDNVAFEKIKNDMKENIKRNYQQQIEKRATDRKTDNK